MNMYLLLCTVLTSATDPDPVGFHPCRQDPVSGSNPEVTDKNKDKSLLLVLLQYVTVFRGLPQEIAFF